LKQSISPDYLLDVAGKLFNRVRAVELKQSLESDLEDNNVDSALERIDKFRKIEMGLGSGINLLSDPSVIESALGETVESLVNYPDAAGGFFGRSLCRDAFIAFEGKDKVGKSFFLQDLAWRGVEQQRNVAYFEVGDMSQPQVIRRFISRACDRPIDAESYPYRYEYPISMDPSTGGTEMPDMKTEIRRIHEPLDMTTIAAALGETSARVGGSRLKLSCHPNSSITVAGIESILEQWERDGWNADVVCIDYSDILQPLDGKIETRDQIDASWRAMRALSQKRHCLVVTATQANKDSYDSWILGRGNFSGDKRKNAHVTGMVGINQTQSEKERGLYRLNWIVRRELDFSEKRCCWLASCLAVSNVCVLSTF
jgi:hypothetical protein